MKKGYGKRILIIFLVLIATSLILIMVMSNSKFGASEDCTIFTSIDEWSFLDDSVIAENAYDDTLVKKYSLKESKNITFFDSTYDANVLVLAYVFENESDCRAYASEVTGNSYNPMEENSTTYYSQAYCTVARQNFPDSSPSWHFAFSGNRCYYISAAMDCYDFRLLLNDIYGNFSEKVDIIAVTVD